MTDENAITQVSEREKRKENSELVALLKELLKESPYNELTKTDVSEEYIENIIEAIERRDDGDYTQVKNVYYNLLVKNNGENFLDTDIVRKFIFQAVPKYFSGNKANEIIRNVGQAYADYIFGIFGDKK